MENIINMNQRTAIFVDGQNIFHSIKDRCTNGRGRLNYSKIVEAYSDYNIVRAITYIIAPAGTDISTFEHRMGQIGFDVRSKEPKTLADNTIAKADWDVQIVIDALTIGAKVDTVVLVTGDGDFIPLCQHLRNMGVRVEVMAFPESVARNLVDAVDMFRPLSNDFILGCENGG